MPSVNDCPSLGDVSTANPIKSDISQQKSANGEPDGVKDQDQSYHERGENRGSELENREVTADQRNWIRPDLPSRCTWRLGAPTSESPHSHPAQ